MKVHQLNGYIQSIYLIEYPHGVLLLDGCCRADLKLIIDFFQSKLNRPLNDLKTIVVTHMHPDHAGAAHKLRKLSGCLIVSADKENQWYKGLNGIMMHWIDVILTLYVGKKMNKGIKNVMYNRKLNPDIKVSHGEKVVHFPDWILLETPGHTDRDLSVFHPDKNWIYVADLMIKLRTRFIAPFPIFHPNKYRKSLKYVKKLAADKVMLAHGGILNMQANDYDQVINAAPQIPRTPLRASLLKIKKITGK